MKILFLQDDFPPHSQGGAGFSTYELAHEMHRKGHEVFVITTSRKKEEAGRSEYHGLIVFTIASNYPVGWRAYVSLYNPFVLRHVRAIIKKVQPDVVHINNIHTYLSYGCFQLSKKYAKSVVFTARDTMAIGYGKLETKKYLNHFKYTLSLMDHIRLAGKGYNPIRNLWIRRALMQADRIFAVSKSLQEALHANGIANVEVIHTGIDASSWEVPVSQIAEFKNRFSLQEKKIVLFGGRLSEGKGGRAALFSFAQVLKEVPGATLIVVGKKDAYAKTMEREAYSLGVADHLIFTGWLSHDEIRVANAIAHVVLVPSLYLDPFPRTAIEGMAAGKPIVGTCYGGTPEIVTDGITGYIVNPLEKEKMAQMLSELLNNPQKAEQFGKAGVQRIMQDFNLQHVVQKYEKAYKSALDGSKPQGN